MHNHLSSLFQKFCYYVIVPGVLLFFILSRANFTSFWSTSVISFDQIFKTFSLGVLVYFPTWILGLWFVSFLYYSSGVLDFYVVPLLSRLCLLMFLYVSSDELSRFFRDSPDFLLIMYLIFFNHCFGEISVQNFKSWLKGKTVLHLLRVSQSSTMSQLIIFNYSSNAYKSPSLSRVCTFTVLIANVIVSTACGKPGILSIFESCVICCCSWESAYKMFFWPYLTTLALRVGKGRRIWEGYCWDD